MLISLDKRTKVRLQKIYLNRKTLKERPTIYMETYGLQVPPTTEIPAMVDPIQAHQRGQLESERVDPTT